MVTTMSRQIGAHDMTFAAGKLAKLADGAVVVTYGQTQVLATCVRSKPREGIDFFPLTIDVEERMYAAGQDPRLVLPARGPAGRDRDPHGPPDRPARCVRPSRRGSATRSRSSCTILSVDMENPYDIPAMNAAACAVGLAGLPFDGPVAAVRLGLIDGEWVVNPTFQETRGRDVRHRRRGLQERRRRRRHPDDRGRGARRHVAAARRAARCAPTEEVVAQGLEVAKTEIAKLIAFQEEFLAAHGVERRWRSCRPRSTARTSGTSCGRTSPASSRPRSCPTRQARDEAFDAVKEEAKAHLADDARRGRVRRARGRSSAPAWKSLQKKVMRRRVIEQGVRLDGRGADGHPSAVGRGRRRAAGPRLGAVRAGATPRCST